MTAKNGNELNEEKCEGEKLVTLRKEVPVLKDIESIAFQVRNYVFDVTPRVLQSNQTASLGSPSLS